MEERLQKYMAECGAGSRRRCETWIAEGRVKVNGTIVTEMGTKIDPEKDKVELNGRKVTMSQPLTTVLLNKPDGYVTTSHDQFGRPNVTELIDMPGVRLYPVGRLDFHTTGLLILTNDGDLANHLTHPSHEMPKIYQALLRGEITQEAVRRLQRGVQIEENFVTSPAEVKVLGIREGNSRVEITIHEGRNHQVKKMAERVGFPVLKLRRIQEGDLKLGNLKEGQYRVLSDKEIESLKKA